MKIVIDTKFIEEMETIGNQYLEPSMVPKDERKISEILKKNATFDEEYAQMYPIDVNKLTEKEQDEMDDLVVAFQYASFCKGIRFVIDMIGKKVNWV